MAENYVVTVGPLSRAEITGGRVGQLVVRRSATSGDYFLGDASVDDTTGLPIVDPMSLYVTSPDEIYVYNQHAVTTGSVKIFHNR